MFKKLRYYLRDYFAFNKTEIKGFMFLIFLIVAFIFSIFIFDFLPDNPKTSKTIDPKRVEEMMAKIEVKESAKKEAYQDRFNNQYEKSDKEFTENRIIKLSPFDPNVASQQELEQLGIASWMAKELSIIVQKAGSFVKRKTCKEFMTFQLTSIQN